jgi:Co/Zn/Cd efflux system component
LKIIEKSQNTDNTVFWSGILALAIGAIGVWITNKNSDRDNMSSDDTIRNKSIAKLAFGISGELLKTIGERTR